MKALRSSRLSRVAAKFVELQVVDEQRKPLRVTPPIVVRTK